MAKSFFKETLHSKLYAKYRPRYTDELFKVIIDYSKTELHKLKLALDIGCGSGQSTFPLAKYFDRVIGVDTSQTQIETANAENSSNVSFIVGDSESLSFMENSTVDLVTCAQSMHWFDRNPFYSELDRILKPSGAFVVYGYRNAILDREDADKLINVDSYFYSDLLGPYWTEDRKHCEDGYIRMVLPYPHARRDDLKLIKSMPVKDFVGYLSSMSSYQKLKKAHPDETELQKVHNKLLDIYGETNVTATWPVFMLSSRKPRA